MIDKNSIVSGWLRTVTDTSNIRNSIIKDSPLIFNCQIKNSIIIGPSGVMLDISNINNSKILNYKQLININNSEIDDSQILDSDFINNSKLKNCSIISTKLTRCDFENVTMVGCGHEELEDLIFKNCFLVSDSNYIYEFDLTLPVFLEPLIYKHIITSDLFKITKHRKILWREK